MTPVDFLIQRCHADKTPHSGRTLLQHLQGTHDLLAQWGARESVRLAGLFHSVYGTVHFRHQSWPLTDRYTIRQLIGAEAEQLAYLFCTLDRPRALVEHAEHPAACGRDWLLAELIEIELANLIEQGGSPWLARLVRLAPFVSDAARAAIRIH